MAIPMLCLVLAFLLLYATKIPVVFAMARRPGGYDNHLPREQQAQLVGWGKRALAAHQNAFEGFAPFAAAVLTAHVSGSRCAWIDGLCITYVIARVLYSVLYIADQSNARSAVWFIGFASTLALFVVPWL